MFLGVKSMWGITKNPMGKTIDSVVNGYNLNTDRDNFIGFSESYIYCYRTYMGYIKSYPWGHSPRN